MPALRPVLPGWAFYPGSDLLGQELRSVQVSFYFFLDIPVLDGFPFIVGFLPLTDPNFHLRIALIIKEYTQSDNGEAFLLDLILQFS